MPVQTYIETKDFFTLQEVAEKNGYSVAAFVRKLILDKIKK